ncbi:Exonuclease SbcC [Pseudomonas sp. OF001]|nr:Exonuclease SbcC [Pseudomonas sp. OF001]
MVRQGPARGDEPGQGAQGRAAGRVRQPGEQAVRTGPDDRRAGHSGHRAGQRPADPRLPAGAAAGRGGAGGEVIGVQLPID